MNEEAQEQLNNSKAPPQLRKYVFKKGVSGNPGGRPAGAVSMKTYAKNYLESMSEEDRVAFMNDLDPKIIWEMAEGKADAKTNLEGNITIQGVEINIRK